VTDPQQRTPTELDRIAEDWIDTLLELDPEYHVWLGRPGREGEYGDYSPEGAERGVEAARATLARVRSARAVDDVDAVTQADLARELELRIEKHDAGFPLRDLNVIASPVQGLREIFDLMPTDSVEDWEVVALRMRRLPAAMDGYLETLRLGIERGIVPARRQVVENLAQARKQTRDDGFFPSLVAQAQQAGVPDALVAELEGGARDASGAYAGLAAFLDEELAPVAGDEDAVGREMYALASRDFLGASVDLDETYQWGIDELARMTDEQQRIAREIVPGGSVADAVALLDADPDRQLHGTEALQRWMQETSDRAVAELGRTHFDIPAPLRALECMIAPTQEGGIYYTPPSDDFGRPGRMWWSVPEGVTTFATWRELTTVYHEGIPGHHLQLGQAVHNRAQLNTWRRNAGTSGHAEGWALYAERLMEQLGYLDDPADRFGMLDGQRMRAARVVLDLGVHLELPKPDGSGPWTGDDAFGFLRANVNMDDGFVRFEVNRYLGWPGQAPSYKIGQRIWEEIRDETAAREGAGFDPRAFHKRALDIGGVGLDTLRAALLPGRG